MLSGYPMSDMHAKFGVSMSLHFRFLAVSKIDPI